MKDDGSEVVTAYASRSLSRPERRYCVTRKELLAVVEFVHHFRHYLLGREFTLRTDHNSLVWVRNFKEPEGQLARWLEKLEEYNFTIVHRRGALHNNADALSRIPCRQCGRDNHNKDEVPSDDEQTVGVLVPLPISQDPGNMGHHQLDDDQIQPVYLAVQNGHQPPLDVTKSWSRESRLLLQQWESLRIKNGILWRRRLGGNESDLQLVLPTEFQADVLRSLHEGATSAHLGEEKMLQQLKERFYWPGCTDAVKDYCATCAICCTRKSAAPKRKAGLQTIQAGYPLQIVCVDIMGPLPETDQGSKYVLVAVDYFTRWVEAYGIPNQEAMTVARKLVDEMFCRFSPPEQLHSDQGRQFESTLVKEICNILGVKKTHTTPYHPQGNGMVERFNRTLLDMLSTTVGKHPSNWEQNIRRVCLAYNSSVHASTGFSPFFLMFGRQVKLPVDLMYGSSKIEEVPVQEYVQKLKEDLQSSYQLVRDRCVTEHKRQKAIYDEKFHGAPFNQGDLVWLHSPAVPRGLSRKLHCPWKGPFKVVERIGNSTYKIKGIRGTKMHFDRLKPCPAKIRLDQEGDNMVQRDSNDDSGEAAHQVEQHTSRRLQLLDEDDDLAAPPPEIDLPEPDPAMRHAEIPEPAPVPEDHRRMIPVPKRYPNRVRKQTDFYGPFIAH